MQVETLLKITGVDKSFRVLKHLVMLVYLFMRDEQWHLWEKMVQVNQR